VLSHLIWGRGNNVIGFSDDIPARPAQEPGSHAEASEQAPANQRQRGILVVDDDDAVRFLLDVGLRHHGFAVWQAADGQEALELYQEDRSEIDLVLLDVRMPRLDGPQTLAALHHLNPEIRCCFMTGHSGNYTEEGLLKLGAARVFPKPFQLAEIAQALTRLMENPPPGSQEPGLQ
jgi:CheY-like chemotaxis protein